MTATRPILRPNRKSRGFPPLRLYVTGTLLFVDGGCTAM
jgi:hypothetical protein